MSEIKDKILVSDFVKGYKKLQNEDLKNKYIKKHVTTKYVSLLLKVNVLRKMHEKAIVNDDVPYVDMITSKLNLNMAILALYTDIEPEKKENEDGTTIALAWEAYDALKSVGLLDKIVAEIGEDVSELLSVQKEILDEWYLKNKSTESYVTNLVETASHKFGAVAGVGMDKLADVLSDEKKMAKIMPMIEKMIKRIK